jgi:hypothetical protein
MYRIKETHANYHVFGRYWSYRKDRYGITVEGSREHCQAFLDARPTLAATCQIVESPKRKR